MARLTENRARGIFRVAVAFAIFLFSSTTLWADLGFYDPNNYYTKTGPAAALAASMGNTADLLARSSSSTIWRVSADLPERIENLGCFFGDNPWTFGKGGYALSLGYAHLGFDEYGGTRLDDLYDISTADYDCAIDADISMFSASYGLLPRLDVGIVVPYIRVKSEGRRRVISPAPREDCQGDTVDGLGDVLLRLKYNLYRDDDRLLFWTLGSDVSLPTGDEKDWLGTGGPQYRLRTMLGKGIGRALPTMELGYFWSGVSDKFDAYEELDKDPGFERSDFNAFEYRLSVPITVTSWYTFCPEIIGNHTEIFSDQMDLGIGNKFSIGKNLTVDVGARIPLNDEGLRTSWFPMITVEWKGF